MLSNKWTKVFFVSLTILIMVIWAINHKDKTLRINNSIHNIYSDIEEMSELHHKLNDNILKSTLYKSYNNDYIVKNVIDMHKKLESIKQNDIYNTKDYPETKIIIEELIEFFNGCEKKIELFKRYNGKIKNSLLFIISSLNNLKNLSNGDNQKILDVISKLTTVQIDINDKNFNYDGIDISFLNLAKSHSNETYINLYKTHIELLKSNLPTYVKLVNKIINEKIFEGISLRLKQSFQKESSIIRKNLDIEYTLLIIFSFFTLLLIIYYILLTEREKQKITRLQSEYKESVTTDLLTGLKNRNAYSEAIKKQEDKTLILFDISGFSDINSLYGVKIGDYVLQGVANKISSSLSSLIDGQVFKVGADQFALVVDKCKDDKALAISNNIVTSIEQEACKFNDIEQPISIQLQVGISSSYPHLINASLAIKSIVDDYSKKIAIYDESLHDTQEMQKNVDMIQKVKYALQNDEITMLFQPIVDLNTKKIIKHEALVRLKDKNEYISPFFFLELSKKAKLYTEISHEVIIKSIASAKEKDVDISINLSIEDILHKETNHFILKTLENDTSTASKLTFELLESEEILNFNAVKEFIKQVKQFGVSIAIDDFGSGYSNYNYLLELDVDILKIDGSLIKNIDRCENNQLIVKSIVEFAKLADIKTVAEFVSTKEIEDVVTKLGIDYVQGFYYSAPKLL